MNNNQHAIIFLSKRSMTTDQTAKPCHAITWSMEDSNKGCQSKQPATVAKGQLYQALNWRFTFISCYKEFVDCLFYYNTSCSKLRRHRLSFLMVASGVFPSTLLKLTPAPLGCPPVKNAISFHGDLIIGE